MLANARKATTQQVLTGLETKRQETRSLAVPGNKLIVMLKPSLEIATRQQEATAAHCALYPDPCYPYPARLQHVSVVCLGVFDDRPPSWLLEKAIGALRRIVARPIAFKWGQDRFLRRQKASGPTRRGAKQRLPSIRTTGTAHSKVSQLALHRRTPSSAACHPYLRPPATAPDGNSRAHMVGCGGIPVDPKHLRKRRARRIRSLGP
jgi:hypothetical protein